MEPEIREFIEGVGAKVPALDVGTQISFRKMFKKDHYFILKKNFLIVKISRTNPPWWGVMKEAIEFLNNLERYSLVLLTSKNDGYVYSKEEINNNIKNNVWRPGKDQNYKIYPAVIKDKNSFFSHNDFLKKIGISNTSHILRKSGGNMAEEKG